MTEQRVATPIRDIPPMAWAVLTLMTVDYVLGMIDRNAVSVLKTTLKEVFQVTDADYSLLVTAFMVPYAIFYVICGRIVDRFGSRVPFAAFVGVWSIATIGSGMATEFHHLVIWRAVLGAAEAGLLPVTIYALVRWFPRDRIAFAYAVKTPVQSLGAILSPPVIAFLALGFGWRWSFYVPGILGLIFAALWLVADRKPPHYPDDAETHLEAEPPRIAVLLRSRTLWGLMLARLVSDPLWFFFQYWQAGYMQEQLGATLADVGKLLWLPPLVTSILTFFTASLTERFARRGMHPAAARMRVMKGAIILSPLVATLPFIGGVPWFLMVVTASYLLGFTWLYLSNILVTDLFPRNATGTVVGLMSAVGTLGAAIFNGVVGTVIDAYGYLPVFLILACVHPIAAVILHLFFRHLPPKGTAAA